MTTSYLVPVPKAQFFDNNGYPLAGGLLYSYAAGTSTPLATYTDATGNTPNTNPVELDASGRADIWLGAALYKLTLTTSAGANIWTEDNIQGNGFFNGVLANYWAGLATGTVNAIILTTNPSVSALTAPIQVSFIAAYTNTGATTINLDGLGVKNLYKQTPSGAIALTGSEIIAGNIYQISYDGTEWQLLNQNQGNPPGTIITFAASTAPAGYLECNGSAISRTTYSILFGIVGTTFGTGDGSTTFNIPDLRGQFVRGWADTGSVDSGRAFGSSQGYMEGPHTHTITDPGHTHIISNAVVNTGSGGIEGAGAPPVTLYYGTATNSSTTGITINNNTGTETRPVNVALMYCIKT